MNGDGSYPKLIRDRIPEIIKTNSGRTPEIQPLADDAAFLKYLLLKIVEEANEVALAADDESLIEELADVEEAIDALLALKNISREAVRSAQTAKRERRGGFAKRLLLLRAAIN